MRLRGVLVGLGVTLIAISGLIELVGVTRWVHDEPEFLMPLPCDQALPVLISSRLLVDASHHCSQPARG